MTRDLRGESGDHVAILPSEALRMIAAGELPCETCGEPHQCRPTGQRNGVTWASPKDGHAYSRLPVETFARQVLERFDREHYGSGEAGQ